MVYELVVNHTPTLVDMIKVGQYDSTNHYITEESFPDTEVGEVMVCAELIHINRWMWSEEVVDEMDRLGFRPAMIHELLAFGQKYPDIQREFSVVALGSYCAIDGRRRVVCLDGDDSRRDLELDWYGEIWRVGSRFLAIRKRYTPGGVLRHSTWAHSIWFPCRVFFV